MARVCRFVVFRAHAGLSLLSPFLSCAVQYDPTTGIYGMDFYVVLKRAGTRVSKRRRCQSTIGKVQSVSKDDSMKWFQAKYDGIILN